MRKFGDPVLEAARGRSSASTTTLRDEIRRMGALMDDALGIGLAATQVGMLHRLLVYQRRARRPVGGSSTR